MVDTAFGVYIPKERFNLNNYLNVAESDATMKAVQESADRNNNIKIAIIGSKAVFVFEKEQEAQRFIYDVKKYFDHLEIKGVLIETGEEA